MILGEVIPMHPIAEQIMVMANEILIMDYIKKIGQLRKLLTGYKIVGPKNKVQSHKSYLKIIKGNQDEAVIITITPIIVRMGLTHQKYIGHPNVL